MNTRQLAKLLEAVVRKVVREELKPIIKENYQIANTSKKVKPTKKFDPLDVSHIFEENISSTNNQKSKINKKSKKVFSKNKVLNGILNETYESDEWRSINSNQAFTSQHAQGFNRGAMAEMIGYGGTKPTVTNMTPTVDPDGRPLNVNLEGTKVGDALTRDYSSLMKKLNSKKGA